MSIVYLKEPAVGLCCERLPTDDGWTWTLNSRLGELLSEAERRYGERDDGWTPLGIEFGGARPAIWYPGNIKTPELKHLIIKLSFNARHDPGRAMFQLAHEVIHLLAPTGGRHAPAFEEGLATIFSEEIAKKFGIQYRYDGPDYIYCKLITNEFLNLYSEAGIRLLRKRERSFHLFTPEILQTVFPSVPDKLAINLCEPFDRIEARLNPTA
jgi:hypothetical protein